MSNYKKMKSMSQKNSPKKHQEDDNEMDVNDNSISIVMNPYTLKSKPIVKKLSQNISDGMCETCLIFTSNLENAIQQIDKYMSSINQRVNSIYFNTPLFNESVLNLDFLHSKIFYTIDKIITPLNIKNQLKNLFVIFFFKEKYQTFL